MQAPDSAAQPEGEAFSLKIGIPHTSETGIELSFERKARKRKAGRGGHKNVYAFSLKKGEEIVSFRNKGEDWYVEGLAFGQLYVVSKMGAGYPDETLQVSLSPRAGSEPLSEDGAKRLAAEEAERRGLIGDSDSYQVRESGGVLEFSRAKGETSLCTILVGLYTRRVVRVDLPSE